MTCVAIFRCFQLFETEKEDREHAHLNWFCYLFELFKTEQIIHGSRQHSPIVLGSPLAPATAASVHSQQNYMSTCYCALSARGKLDLSEAENGKLYMTHHP